MSGMIPLRRVTRLAYGDALASEARGDGIVPVVGSGGVSGTHDKSNFGAPGIVVGRKGSYGSIHWVPSAGFAIDTAYYIDEGLTSANLRWLYYVLQAVDLRGPSQDVGVPGLSREAAYAMLVPDPPPLAEQRRIADFLDAETARIDKLVSFQERLYDLLIERDNSLRDGLLHKLFETEGEAPLRRVTLGIEQGTSPQCETTPASRGEWGVLKLSAVKRGRFDHAENKRLPDEVTPATAYEVKAGDLLVTRANTPSLVGDVAVVGEGASQLLLPDLIYRVRLTDTVSAEFIAQVALGRRTRALIEATARGSSQSMVKLRGEDIKSWPIPKIGKPQQAEFLHAIRQGTAQTQHLRSLVQRQLALLTERRQALITAAVTGQFDITTAGGRNVTEGVSA
ncbi:hypothetical protein ABZW51_08790 [Streptomyces cellulosae]